MNKIFVETVFTLNLVFKVHFEFDTGDCVSEKLTLPHVFGLVLKRWVT